MYDKIEALEAALSEGVLGRLRAAGWVPGRDMRNIAETYARELGPRWAPAAAPFVRMLAGLDFYGKLWVWGVPLWADRMTADAFNFIEMLKRNAVPVASSAYIGDECVIWIDQDGWFYAVDSEGAVYLGSDAVTALDVLLLGESAPEPPLEIRDAMAKAYDWHSKEEGS